MQNSDVFTCVKVRAKSGGEGRMRRKEEGGKRPSKVNWNEEEERGGGLESAGTVLSIRMCGLGSLVAASYELACFCRQTQFIRLMLTVA